VANSPQPLKLTLNRWFGDSRLRACSPPARALWIDLLWLMHESPERGILSTTTDDTASLVGLPVVTFMALVGELVLTGVAVRLSDKRLACQWMASEEALRKVYSAAGKRGGARNTVPSTSSVHGKALSTTEHCKAASTTVHGLGVCVQGSGVVQVEAAFTTVQPKALSTTEHCNAPSTTANGRTHQPADVSLFATFWAAYPRKQAKQAAVKAWAKLDPDKPLLDVMLAAVERQRKSRQWVEGYVPHPASWLNGRRWEDEAEPDPGPLFAGPSLDDRLAEAAKRLGG
jgi:hypothetical protein